MAYLTKRLDYWDKQEDILRLLHGEIEYLFATGGHIQFFRDSISPNGYPHHSMSELNVNFYWTKLAHNINSVETLEIKNKIKKANDKIRMLNEYRVTETKWRKMMNHGGNNKYLKGVLTELEGKLREIQEYINLRFQIKMNTAIHTRSATNPNTIRAKRIASEFLWVSGISLIVVGATQIWINKWAVFFAGVTIMFIGVVGKTLYEQ